MAEDRLSDGKRIAQLLASEIEGLGGVLESVGVVDADPDVEPTTDGAFAYAIASDAEATDREGEEPERIAEVYVQPDRARIEFIAGQEAAVDVAEEQSLRVRPKASRPPRTLVFVEDGAEVKRAVPVVKAVVEATESADE